MRRLRMIVQDKRLMLVPVFGILIFVMLYTAAGFLYPGGSQHDLHAPGFSLLHNYWCNLLPEKAMNGALNTARPVALAAMFVLSLSLSTFWWFIPVLLTVSGLHRIIIRVSGLLAMLIGLFLFLEAHHDLMTYLSAFFGLIATVFTMAGLYRNNWKRLYFLALFNLFLVLLNGLLYQVKELLVFLPVVQKITFLVFLIWICLICFQIRKPAKYGIGTS